MNRMFQKYVLFFFLFVFGLFACSSVRSVQIKRAKDHYEKGQYLSSKGDLDRAMTNFEKSINMARAADYQEGIAHNLNELALIHTGRGEYTEAREYLKEALEIYRKLDMAPEISKAMNNMANTYTRERRPKEAIEWFNRLIEWDIKTGNQTGVGITHYNMAQVYYRQLHMKDKARECLHEALKIFEETGNQKYIDMIRGKSKED